MKKPALIKEKAKKSSLRFKKLYSAPIACVCSPGHPLAKAKELKLDDSEEVMLLRHMVLSHHGVYEYGSPVLPMIPEAEMLYMIDNIDGCRS